MSAGGCSSDICVYRCINKISVHMVIACFLGTNVQSSATFHLLIEILY